MQQDMNFRAVAALRVELTEVIERYNRFVTRIISIEEFAEKVEKELTRLQQKLRGIVSNNRLGRDTVRNNSNTESGNISLTGRASAPNDHSPGFKEPSMSLYEETVDFFNRFLVVGKSYRHLTYRINSIDDTADSIDSALRSIQERLKDAIYDDSVSLNRTGITLGSLKYNKIPRRLLEALRWSAESGIPYLGVKRFSNGKAEFEIEGTKLILPPRLTKLLIALSKDIGSSEDDLVGWKSLEQLAQLVLSPKRGTLPKDTHDRKKRHHAILQSIHLLRKSLFLEGMNPFLIQRNPQLGYRFALKRGQAPKHEINLQ